MGSDAGATGAGVPPADDRRDPGGMAAAMAGLADQIETGWSAARQALKEAGWRGPVPSATAPCPGAFAGGVISCGMGGSAIGADVVRAAVPRLPVPFEAVRGFDLPRWAGPDSVVIATSYSGSTVETLSCVEAAAEQGCTPVCVTGGGALTSLAAENGWPLVPVPGGLQPRAALGYLLSAVAAVLQAAGLGADLRTQVPQAVAVLRERAAALAPDADEAGNEARGIAARLRGRVAVIYGAGVTVPAARRWKTQINENAKAPAYFVAAPELLHNEVCGWAGATDADTRIAAVVLSDGQGDQRLRRRMDLVARSLEDRAATVVQVECRGTAPLARCLSALTLGDWTSYYLALLNGVDPTPVPAIEELKQVLGRAAS
jgi:glucose/mannose-6-phosphate isomerase